MGWRADVRCRGGIREVEELRVEKRWYSKPGGLNAERGDLQQVRGCGGGDSTTFTFLSRMASRAENLLHQSWDQSRCAAFAGTEYQEPGVFLTAEYENSLAGFSALGRVGCLLKKWRGMAG